MERCQACLVGMYTSADTTFFVCADCPAGKFQPLANLSYESETF
jgi:hypothetical protein